MHYIELFLPALLASGSLVNALPVPDPDLLGKITSPTADALTKTGVACAQWAGVGCAAAVLPDHPASKVALAVGAASAAGNTQDAIGKWKKANDEAAKKKAAEAARLPTHNPPSNQAHAHPPTSHAARPAPAPVGPPPKGPPRYKYSDAGDAEAQKKEKYRHKDNRPAHP